MCERSWYRVQNSVADIPYNTSSPNPAQYCRNETVFFKLLFRLFTDHKAALRASYRCGVSATARDEHSGSETYLMMTHLRFKF
jgi:hypothetical protein